MTLESDVNRPAAARDLTQHLLEFSEAQIGPRNTQDFTLTVREADGQLIAGLTGEFFWNALYVAVLWVGEPARRQGYGRALMQEAESMARTRGCDISFLFTMTFQAPEFYRKLGYEPIGELLDSPRGHTRFWLAKRLDIADLSFVAELGGQLVG